MACSHEWITNSGMGGEPLYETNRMMSLTPLMHVKCSNCNGRTWLTEKQWEDLEKTDSA